MIKHLSKIYTKNMVCRAVLIAGDIISVAASFYLAYNLRVFLNKAGVLAIDTPQIKNYFHYWYLLLIPVFFLNFYRIYNSRPTFWQELKKIIKALLISAVFIFFILALLKISQEVSRVIIILMGIISTIMVPSVKLAIKFILYKIGIWHADALIIADVDDEFESFLRGLDLNWYVGYRQSVIMNVNSIGEGALSADLSRDRLEDIIKSKSIVLPILYKVDKNKFYDVFIRLDMFFDTIKLIPDLHSLFVNNISIEGDGENLIINFSNNLLRPYNRIIQYLFNKVASLLIAVCISPALLIIMILIKLDSRGPAFYRAGRIGYNEKDIHVYKFRTMFGDADRNLEQILNSSPEKKKEFEENFKLKDDPRVTRVGRFLRKTSLDELPQIFNVLKGEMNLVGPRPIVRAEVPRYGDAFYELIKVKPGISGLWQISGRNDIEYSRRVQLDLFYIKNWSLWMDIVILLKTFVVVLQGRGAY